MEPSNGKPKRVAQMTSQTRFAIFETNLGACAVAWSECGVVGLQLPEAGLSETRARLVERFPGARETSPPRSIQRAIAATAALLAGEAGDLSAIALDLNGVPPFHRRVYELARAIPRGTTLSYGDIAARLGVPGAARAVGQALARNPFAMIVPCHRVLTTSGKPGGFSANGGVLTKLRLLALEGVEIGPSARAPSGGGAFDFDPRVAADSLRQADPVLGRLIAQVGPFALKLKATRSTFAALAEAIVHQQLTARAAASIFARLCASCAGGRDGPTAAAILAATDETLRAAGLSRAKLLALRDLAEKTRAGEIPTLGKLRAMQDEAIIERLTRVRGIGRWTVEMLLMFRLGRADVLPVDDYGLRKGFALAFGRSELPSPKDLEAHGARWKPYRTVASWYLWRAVDLLPNQAKDHSLRVAKLG